MRLDIERNANNLPALGDKGLLGDVEAEHVEAVVDGLDLPHLRVPGPQVVGPVRQQPSALVLGFVEDGVQIFQAIGGFRTYLFGLLLFVFPNLVVLV